MHRSEWRHPYVIGEQLRPLSRSQPEELRSADVVWCGGIIALASFTAANLKVLFRAISISV